MIPSIETDRLLLRPWRLSDEDAVWETLLSDPEVTRYLPVDAKRSRASVDGRAERANALWSTNGVGYWAVEHRTTGEFMGHCGLNFLEPSDEIEVLYAFGRTFWGQGYATEAANASVQFGFREKSYDKIIALAIPENAASRRVMEKIGMAYERDGRYFDLDVVIYSIMRPTA
jgi:RimJ/RimL family protein N-acetyltransferase